MLLVVCAGVAYVRYKQVHKVTGHSSSLRFGGSVSPAEQQTIRKVLALASQKSNISQPIEVKTSLSTSNPDLVLNAYVPVTNVYASRQSVTSAELAKSAVYVPDDMDAISRTALSQALAISPTKLLRLKTATKDINSSAVAFVPVSQLSLDIKLLAFNGDYYLDSFNRGAVFRQVDFGTIVNGLKLNSLPKKTSVLKVNMTGTTALTRKFILKLPTVNDASFFSQKIGPFLADADITHVSNEVSFQEGCKISTSVFCAPPQMIDVLKASGVDLVELTGNHNNDVGAENDAATIKLYHSLGWQTVGGGLNSTEAAKPYIANQKGSKIAFLAYNDADGPHSGAIAGAAQAGANAFNFEKVKADIIAAKKQAQFVIVDVQYLECYAYPDGYVIYPVCDGPIPNQEQDFRQIADLGANIVIGTQAHHPQTYENYRGVPIYYGLGNLYFDQVEWPDTERGMILTHYFAAGKLLQTKLSPTVFDTNLQTHLTTNDDASAFLQRLGAARPTASN